MKIFYYIRYFFYIAWHWNIRLAAFTIYHEIRGESKYKIDTVKLDMLNKAFLLGDTLEQAEIYQGASYYLLEKVFDEMENYPAPLSLLDYGSGKGRVLAVAANFPFTTIRGIDFAAELVEKAAINLVPIIQEHPEIKFELVHINALDYIIPSDVNTFFFFNPFNEIIMTEVLENILISLIKAPRKIFIIYINPQHKELFISRGFKEIYSISKMRYIAASILTNRL